MGQIDLHVHSGYSQGGAATPAEVVNAAADMGLSAISLTDHDTIAGTKAAMAAAEARGIRCVPGVEVTTHYSRRSLTYHLLAYMYDPEHPSLRRFFNRLSEAMAFNLRQTMEVLKGRDICVNWSILRKVTRQLYPDLPDRQPDWTILSAALVRLGYAPDVKAADEICERAVRETPQLIGHPEQELVFKKIKRARGLVFMAHPQGFFREHFAPERVLREMIAEGLDGIEAYSRKHDEELTRWHLELAERTGCKVSGGSDCHDVRRAPGTRTLGCSQVPEVILGEMDAHRELKFGIRPG